MSPLRAANAALQLTIAVLLGACAGGGGGGSTLLPPPPPLPPPSFSPPAPPPPIPPLAPPHAAGNFPSASSAEYTNNWGVAGSNAIVAWQNGATGQGVTIGVIDDGVDPYHPELTGRISPDSTDIVPGRNALTTTLSHGSELSSLIAGNFNGSQTVGAAFDATILAVRADNGADGFDEGDLAAGLNYAVAHGVKVVNFSLGSSAPTSAAFRTAIANATAAGVIIVVSAGNSGPSATQVNYPAFFAANASVSHGLMLIGGGLNQDGTVNNISNLPGQNENWYLTAPAWEIIVPDFGPVGPVPGFQRCGAPFAPTADTCQIQGTSYASPYITAAAALVMSGFPGLTPSQVVQLLLTTADDTGAPGVDAINGAGRLNIGRAFQPVGPLRVPFSDGVTVTADTPLGTSGTAFGDALAAPSSWATVGFDNFGRTFPINLAGNWVRAGAGPALVASAPELWREASSENGVRMSFAEADSIAPDSLRLQMSRDDLERAAVRIEGEIAPGLTMSFAANGAQNRNGAVDDSEGHLGFVNADSSLRLTRRIGPLASFSLISETGSTPVGLMHERSTRTATVAQLGLGRDALGLDVSYGAIRDEEGLLGLVWSDALGRTPGGDVRFAGIAAHYAPTPRLLLRASAEMGAADFTGKGWLAVAAPLRTTAFSLAATYSVTPSWIGVFGDHARGDIVVSLSQPLRVESGAFSALLPTATKYGISSLTYEARTIDAAPSGRELRFGVGYNLYADDWLSAFAEATYISEPGHVAGADSEDLLRVGVRLRR